MSTYFTQPATKVTASQAGDNVCAPNAQGGSAGGRGWTG
jgi:hypothetical protein